MKPSKIKQKTLKLKNNETLIYSYSKRIGQDSSHILDDFELKNTQSERCNIY